jgi:hypothetical protein
VILFAAPEQSVAPEVTPKQEEVSRFRASYSKPS